MLRHLSPALALLLVARAAHADDDTLTDDELLELALEEPAEDDDGEVIVVTGAPPDLAQPTAYTLDRASVRSLPGTGNDVLRAAQSVPGVGRIAYGLGGLVMRGTNPHDTNVYLDGIEVPIAFHFAGLSSFYPSTLLDELVVSPGGSDVVYGRAVGGVVELKSRAGRRDRWGVGSEIGVLDASTYAEGPTGQGSIALGVRRSYADALLSAFLPDFPVLPRYYDGQLRWDYPVAGGTLTAQAFFSDDRMPITGGGGSFSQYFLRGSLRYRRRIGGVTASVMPWAGTNSIGVTYADAEVGEAPLRLSRQPFGLRADAAWDHALGHAAIGLDVQGARVAGTTPTVEGDLDDDPMLSATTAYRWFADVGLWAETRWRIDGGKLSVKPGVRADYLGVSKVWTFDPRVVFTHELAPWFTLRETLGLYHQPPAPAWIFVDDGFIPPKQGTHASIGVNVRLPADVRASATVFHVETRGVDRDEVDYFDSDADDGDGGTEIEVAEPPPGPDSGGGNGIGNVLLENLIAEEAYPTLPGRGRSSGVELSLQRKSARWLFLIAYTGSVAMRDGAGDGATPLGWAPYALDQTHNLSAVASVALGKWQIGGRVRYTTGFPYTPQTGSTTDADGNTVVMLGPPNSARLPAFATVDVRVDRRWRRGYGTIALFIDVQNVSNERNPEGAYYEDGIRKYSNGLPVLPQFGVSFTPPGA